MSGARLLALALAGSCLAATAGCGSSPPRPAVRGDRDMATALSVASTSAAAGEYAAAAEQYAVALERAYRTDSRAAIADIAFDRAVCLLESGDPRAADRARHLQVIDGLLREADAYATSDAQRTDVRLAQARVRVERGDTAADLQSADSLAGPNALPAQRTAAHLLVCCAALARNDAGRARRELDDATASLATSDALLAALLSSCRGAVLAAEAARAGTTERSGLLEEAVRQSLDAAVLLRKSHAYAEMTMALERAAASQALLGRASEAVVTWLRAGRCWWASGAADSALHCVRSARAICAGGVDADLAARVESLSGEIVAGRGSASETKGP